MGELLRIFDENYQYLEVAEREVAHKEGLWHETFHCWLYFFEAGECYLLLQKRSLSKKDFPNKFDISAAGHLSCEETPMDGLRELSEELGITVSSAKLTSIGSFPVEVDEGDFHDREFSNIFLLEAPFIWGNFTLQEEEVSGLYAISLKEFEKVMAEANYEVAVYGFQQNAGKKTAVCGSLSQKNTCCHSIQYFDYLFTKIHEILG